MTTTQLATFTSRQRGIQADPFADMVRQVVMDAAQRAPRSQQTALGPSEIGDPCARKLAMKTMGVPAVNTDSDPWASIVGTAVHSWLADTFEAANRRLGRLRYLVEKRLQIMPGLQGSCDLFDVDTWTVADWKILGPTSLTAIKKNGAPPYYRAQAHLYGLGFAQLGLPVRDVVLACFPRSGLLSGLHIWRERYDEQIAAAALARYWQIIELADVLDLEHNPAQYAIVPREAGHRCLYCPFLKPGADTGLTCPGHLGGELAAPRPAA